MFGLLQKDYASHRVRALAATARLEKMPAMLRTARTSLTKPVKLYAQLAIEAARGGDELYTTSLMTLADELSASERKHRIGGAQRARAGHRLVASATLAKLGGDLGVLLRVGVHLGDVADELLA